MATSIPGRDAAIAGAAPVTHHRTETVDPYPDAEFHLLDTGHIALEDKADVMVPLIRDFLERKVALY
jgi:hypothetical protein